MTETELAQAVRLRQDFPGWVVLTDDYGFTGRRRVHGVPESYGPHSAAVLRSHLMNAEVGDVFAEVLARSA